jgi:diguanylate cyclase (GGDEF)-like protein/putative nucleotidyltransferase with HDIG domain
MNQLLVLIYWGIPIIALTFSLGIFAILALSKKDKMINAFMLMMASMVLWSFATLMMKLSIQPGALFWNRVMVGALMLIPYTGYLFFMTFVRMRRRFALMFWGVLEVLMQIVNAMGYTTTAAVMKQVPYSPYVELEYTLGIGAYVSYVLIFALLLTCLFMAQREYKKSRYLGGLKNVIIALFIIFVGIGANLVPVIGKYPIDFFAGSIASMFIMWAIYRNRVLELKFVITKAVIFTILLTAVTVASIFAVNGLIGFFQNLGMDTNLFILIVTFVSLIVFQPIFKFIYSLVNHLFYKEEKAREERTEAFTRQIANNLKLSSVAEALMSAVSDISGNLRNYLFLYDEERKAYTFYMASKRLENLSVTLSSQHPFVLWFEQYNDLVTGKQLDTNPFFKTMWDEDRRALNSILFEVAIPLKANGKLIGMVLMCHKDTHSIKDMEHTQQINILGMTASLAISNALMFEKAREEATIDNLTQTFNHRYFMDELAEATAKTKTSLTLALSGVDQFNIYNDLYGHYEGDHALSKIAAKIKQVVGDRGLVCRYQGDIFAIILPDMDTKKAYDLIEKIRVVVEGLTIASAEDPYRHLTLSTGLCTFPIQANDDKILLKNAGLALAEAKRSGRNRTVLYNSTVAEDDENTTLDENQLATVYALTAAIDAKDHITFGHSQRVAQYATAIASAMGAKPSEVETIRLASLLHDIGKIGIPEDVLTKTTRLTTEEYEIMKKHVDLSITIIKHMPSFAKVIPSVIGHHERWDGKGYPRHLAKEEIPFGARCIAVADAFDAITSDRHYKSLYDIDIAVQEIERNAGTQFDPDMAITFAKLVREGKVLIEPTRSTIYSIESFLEKPVN